MIKLHEFNVFSQIYGGSLFFYPKDSVLVLQSGKHEYIIDTKKALVKGSSSRRVFSEILGLEKDMSYYTVPQICEHIKSSFEEHSHSHFVYYAISDVGKKNLEDVKWKYMEISLKDATNIITGYTSLQKSIDMVL